jgi:hypothetical protein
VTRSETVLADAARVPDAARRIADAARGWLESLDPEQRKAAGFPFDSDERYVWDYRPGPRKGVPLKHMSAAQRDAAIALLDATLSSRGSNEARAIMALEVVLGELEARAGIARWHRDPELYWFSVFGEPGGGAPWSCRVGGHHVAVHVTIVAREYVAVTPLFFGANPATVPSGSHAGHRILGAEEDLARDLLAHLDPARKMLAIVEAVAPADILTKNYRRADPDAAPAGIVYAQLTGEQREHLVRLVRHYVDRAVPEVAAVEWRQIEAAGLDEISFAWAGSEARGQGHYYAVRGPRFLIEYDNTQNDANHIHAVWRDFTNDWGEDLLAAHYAESHVKHES